MCATAASRGRKPQLFSSITMGRTIKIIFLVALVLLFWGYLARQLDVYFFWDSKAFGWIILFIGIFFYLIDLHKLRTRKGKGTIWVKIGIVFMAVGFGLLAFLISDFNKSEPYQIAIAYLKSDAQLKDEVGNIKGFGLIPSGSIETNSVNGSESGRATLFLTVFGDKKYKDIDVNLRKTGYTDWSVISVY
jgi:hypothetical protein